MQEIKTEKKEYGILMQLIRLNNGFYIYVPTYLVEGKIDLENGLFVDNLNSSYMSIHDSSILSSDFDLAVGYIMTEEELLEKYENSSLDEAKTEYFDEMAFYCYFGFYVEDSDKIVTIAVDMEYLDAYFNGIKSDNATLEDTPAVPFEAWAEAIAPSLDGEVIDIKEEEISEQPTLFEFKDSNGEKVIPLSQKEIDNIINLGNYERIKEELERIRRIDKYLRLEPVYDNDSSLENKSDSDTKKDDTNKNEDILERLDVNKIKQVFDERIIGQEEAKRDIISAVFMNEVIDDTYNRNSCLLIGPTGSGKSLIAKTAGLCFDKPLVEVDMTQLSSPGYKGANLEDFLLQLVVVSSGNLQKAQKGIVVLNEIDKKGSESNGDISGRGVLNCLLPFFEGATYSLEYHNRTIIFDTSHLTIFATGSFTELIEKKRLDNKNRIGFTSDMVSSNSSSEDISYFEIEDDDLVKYGNIPSELVGRISVVTQLAGHTIETLKRILIESRISALLSERAKLNALRVNLDWHDEYLDSVAEKAFNLKQGARSLKKIVEKSVKSARWHILTHPKEYTSIILTAGSVNDNEDCILIDKNGYECSLKEILSIEKQKQEQGKDKVMVKSL